MLVEMGQKRAAVVGNDDAACIFGPTKQICIARAQRQIGRIADAHHIERIGPAPVVPLHGVPKLAAQLLIETKRGGMRQALSA